VLPPRVLREQPASTTISSELFGYARNQHSLYWLAALDAEGELLDSPSYTLQGFQCPSVDREPDSFAADGLDFQ
jgi:hypothetical protein